MITSEGYRNWDKCYAEGIAVTFGQKMIQDKGGLRKFLRWFNEIMCDEGGLWLHKMKNVPTQDVDYVYVIIANRVYCRAFFGGRFKKGERAFMHPDDLAPTELEYSGIYLGGPILKSQIKIKASGFQGFRYTTKLF